MTTISELITATLKLSVEEQNRNIIIINQELIRLLAAEYEFDPELAIAKFLDDDYVIPDESPGTVKVPKEKGKKKKAKKEVDPDAPVKPKKSKNAFMIFTAANREQVKADNPDIKPTDISKKMGEMWADLTNEEQQIFDQLGPDADGKVSVQRVKTELKAGGLLSDNQRFSTPLADHKLFSAPDGKLTFKDFRMINNEYVEEAEKLKAEYLEKKTEWEDEMKAYEEAKAACSD